MTVALTYVLNIATMLFDPVVPCVLAHIAFSARYDSRMGTVRFCVCLDVFFVFYCPTPCSDAARCATTVFTVTTEPVFAVWRTVELRFVQVTITLRT